MALEKLRILLVEQRDGERSALARRLEDVGCLVIGRTRPGGALAALARESQPDVVVIDAAIANARTVAVVAALATDPQPVVVFADESDGDAIQGAIRAGAAGYVVKGAQPERVRPVLEVAIARFAAHRALVEELDGVRASLEERKVVDRAKGLLMEKRGLSEGDAYAALRKMAMDKSVRLVDVGRRVIEMADLL